MRKILIAGIISVVLALPLSVFAQGNINNAVSNLGKLGKKAGTTETDISNVVGKAINAALTLVGITFLILMVYAGYLWMTARGEEAPIENAKKIVRAAIIGIVLVMSAYAITFFVTSRFESADPAAQQAGTGTPPPARAGARCTPNGGSVVRTPAFCANILRPTPCNTDPGCVWN